MIETLRTAPSNVQFHIAAYGVEICKLVQACVVSADTPHYNTYLEAQTAYEALGSVSPAPSQEAQLTYEDLQKPALEDIKLAQRVVANYFFYEKGFLTQELGNAHNAFWFANNVEDLVEVSVEHAQELKVLRKQSSDAEVQARIQKIVRNYRTADAKKAFDAFLQSSFFNSEEGETVITKIASRYAFENLFARAIAQGVSIPRAISREFEQVWNDEFAKGSKKNVETELQSVTINLVTLLRTPDPELFAREEGFADAAQASTVWNATFNMLHEYLRTRGRSNQETVRAILDKFELI